MNATIKSGTNGFHGVAWEFFRNDVLDANAYFSDPATQRKPELRQNQFGAVAGGRIIRDKTFWFADYEGTRIHQGVLWNGIWVPTTPEVSSGYTNFTDLLNATGTFTRKDALGRSFSNGQIFDPATTRAVTAGQVDPVTGIMATANGYVREPFANNQLPAGRLDPNAIKLLQLYPAANLSGVQNNYQTTKVNTSVPKYLRCAHRPAFQRKATRSSDATARLTIRNSRTLLLPESPTVAAIMTARRHSMYTASQSATPTSFRPASSTRCALGTARNTPPARRRHPATPWAFRRSLALAVFRSLPATGGCLI